MGLDSQATAFGAGLPIHLSGQNLLALILLTAGTLLLACAVGLICRRKVRLLSAPED